MPTGARRAHTKSRHGCSQCKKNRTKCDEQRPSCGRCFRTGVKCSLIDPISALIIINGSTTKAKTHAVNRTERASPPTKVAPIPRAETTAIQTSAKQTVTSQSVQVNNEERDRLRLMSHYVNFTIPILCGLVLATPEGLEIWRIKVPELGFKHDFLLHGMLSIAALHIAMCNPDVAQEHRIMAIQHHTAAITHFTPHLSNITEENIDALFAFACLNTLYSFGIHLKGDLKLSPLVKIHEIFTMLRGTGIIVRSGLDWLENGIFRPWFPRDDLSSLHKLPVEITEAIDRLRGRVSSTITTSSQSELYFTTIEMLRLNLYHAAVLPRTQMALVFLPVMAPSEFIQMICIAEPLALAILANWAVVMHWQRNHLWLQNWGVQTIRAVQEVLPPDWQPCIEWSLNELENSSDPKQLLTPDYSGMSPCETERSSVRSPTELIPYP